MKPKSKYYVLLHCGWEYNDEIFYRGESAGGYPSALYKNKKKAQDDCDIKNINEFENILRREELNYYGYYGLDEEKIESSYRRLTTVEEKIKFIKDGPEDEEIEWPDYIEYQIVELHLEK